MTLDAVKCHLFACTFSLVNAAKNSINVTPYRCQRRVSQATFLPFCARAQTVAFSTASYICTVRLKCVVHCNSLVTVITIISHFHLLLFKTTFYFAI